MYIIFLIADIFGNLFLNIIGVFVYVFLVLFIIHKVQKIRSFVPEAKSNGCHSFDFQFSSQQFYTVLEEKIKQREMPSLTVSRVIHKEGGLFSSDRIYLRIARGHLIYDVCAAPYGNGFFVSSWQGKTLHLRRRLIAAIPVFGEKLEKAFYSQTYFQADTEAMFHGGVHSCLQSAIDTLTASYGIRPITEADKRAHDLSMNQ
jgi:hypothetical protein